MGERRTRWQPPPSRATEITRSRNVLAWHATLSGASTHTAALSQQIDDALRDSEVLRECCCAFAVHFASMTVKWNFALRPLTLKRLCTGAGTLRSSTTVQLIHLRLQIGNEIELFATVQPPASYYIKCILTGTMQAYAGVINCSNACAEGAKHCSFSMYSFCTFNPTVLSPFPLSQPSRCRLAAVSAYMPTRRVCPSLIPVSLLPVSSSCSFSCNKTYSRVSLILVAPGSSVRTAQCTSGVSSTSIGEDGCDQAASSIAAICLRLKVPIPSCSYLFPIH